MVSNSLILHWYYYSLLQFETKLKIHIFILLWYCLINPKPVQIIYQFKYIEMKNAKYQKHTFPKTNFTVLFVVDGHINIYMWPVTTKTV